MTKKKTEMKNIIGFSRYSFNTTSGEVFDNETKQYKTANPNQTGYVYVTLKNDVGEWERLSLHRLIYMAHTGESIPLGMHIHHKDNDRSNNCINNLMVVTASENLSMRQVKTSSRRLSKEENEKLFNEFDSLKIHYGNTLSKFKILAEEFKISVRAIQMKHRKYLELKEAA